MYPVHIFRASFDSPLPADLYNKYLNILPAELQQINQKYRRWQDRHAHLYGKIMLIKGLNLFGFNKKELADIRYNEFGKPSLNVNLQFNLSHSGNYALCALGTEIKIGIDIEEIRNVDINDFKALFTGDEWRNIVTAEDSLDVFFKFWTIKESVLKAEGTGLSAILADIRIENKLVKSGDRTWYISDLDLSKGYHASLATDRPIEPADYKLMQIDLSNPGELSKLLTENGG